MATGIAALASSTALRLRVSRGIGGQWSVRSRLFASNSSPSSLAAAPRKLILYSKPGCCLCDGLKEKLDAAFPFPDALDLEIRDITTDPQWENAYQYEIPVLAALRPDGTEHTLPRLSPRLKPHLIRTKIEAAFTDS